LYSSLHVYREECDYVVIVLLIYWFFELYKISAHSTLTVSLSFFQQLPVVLATTNCERLIRQELSSPQLPRAGPRSNPTGESAQSKEDDGGKARSHRWAHRCFYAGGNRKHHIPHFRFRCRLKHYEAFDMRCLHLRTKVVCAQEAFFDVFRKTSTQFSLVNSGSADGLYLLCIGLVSPLRSFGSSYIRFLQFYPMAFNMLVCRVCLKSLNLGS